MQKKTGLLKKENPRSQLRGTTGFPVKNAVQLGFFKKSTSQLYGTAGFAMKNLKTMSFPLFSSIPFSLLQFYNFSYENVRYNKIKNQNVRYHLEFERKCAVPLGP